MGKLEKVGDRVVVKLVYSTVGNYKLLDNGKKITLTDAEWRKELTKVCNQAKEKKSVVQKEEIEKGFDTLADHLITVGSKKPLARLAKVGDKPKLKKLGKVGKPQLQKIGG